MLFNSFAFFNWSYQIKQIKKLIISSYNNRIRPLSNLKKADIQNNIALI